jgi:hypothetical protein
MITGLKYRLHQAKFNLKYATKGLRDYSRLTSLSKSGIVPQIAAVMVGRNDDYMPDFGLRLRATLEWNIRYLITEPIFVEWNPPADRELLAYRLVKEFPTLKVFVVPREIHEMVCQNPKLALMEYHAKNVGLRRASSEWVMATNADVAIAPETILACRDLQDHQIAERRVFIAERVDIDWTEWRGAGIGPIDCLRFKRMVPVSPYGTGDFLMAKRDLWHQIEGYDENLLRHRIGCDARGAAQMRVNGAQIEKIGRVLHLAHPTSCTEDGVQPHHGEAATLTDLPYQNGSCWGQGDRRLVEIGERIWQLV